MTAQEKEESNTHTRTLVQEDSRHVGTCPRTYDAVTGSNDRQPHTRTQSTNMKTRAEDGLCSTTADAQVCTHPLEGGRVGWRRVGQTSKKKSGKQGGMLHTYVKHLRGKTRRGRGGAGDGEEAIETKTEGYASDGDKVESAFTGAARTCTQRKNSAQRTAERVGALEGRRTHFSVFSGVTTTAVPSRSTSSCSCRCASPRQSRS